MADKTLKTRIALRRDVEANFSGFTPLKGEICLADTASGLKAKVGDGTKTYNELPYTDQAIQEEIKKKVMTGYYFNGNFYTDSTYVTLLPTLTESIYINLNTDSSGVRTLYTYDGSRYVCINERIPNATESVAGIMKLYQTSGQGVDGAMSQKTVTDGVNSIKFAVDTVDTECLILDLP